MRYRISDLLCCMSFSRATPCCSKHIQGPLPCWGHLGRTFWTACASCRPRMKPTIAWNTVSLQFLSWKNGIGHSPYWRPVDLWSVQTPQWVSVGLTHFLDIPGWDIWISATWISFNVLTCYTTARGSAAGCTPHNPTIMISHCLSHS